MNPLLSRPALRRDANQARRGQHGAVHSHARFQTFRFPPLVEL